MKDIDEIRRENLRLLERECGGPTAAAERVGMSPAQFANLRDGARDSRTGKPRGMRKETARRIEESCGKPAGWLDAEHDSRIPNASISAPKGGLTKELPTSVRDNLTEDSPQTFGKHKNVEVAPIGQRKIPVISYVQAGMMTEVVDPFELGDGLETITTHLDLSEGAFGLRIKGESMLPEFREGDVIIIDPAEHPLPGDFVVAKNGEEEATFKKYRPRSTNDRGDMIFELVPLNDDFPTLNSERDHMSIIGVMVEHRKYRRR
jgi:SOS-response transcriptional repressor LexA